MEISSVSGCCVVLILCITTKVAPHNVENNIDNKKVTINFDSDFCFRLKFVNVNNYITA